MIVFGLTGSIAVGKSTVAKTFQAHGIPVIDADQVAREVVKPGRWALKELTRHFGEDILFEDGSLNRAKLGELVFSHPNPILRQENMGYLNAIMDAPILYEMLYQLGELRNQEVKLACWDAALLIEKGKADMFRPLVVVHCTLEQQVERLIRRNGLTREQAVDRIGSQLPTAEKLKLADYSIDTSGSIAESVAQTEVIIPQLRKLIK